MFLLEQPLPKPKTMATHMVAAARKTFRELHGVVVSAGLMDRTVKVRVGGREWNGFLKKVGKTRCSLLLPKPSIAAFPVVVAAHC